MKMLTFVSLLALVGVAIFDDLSRPENAATDEVVSSFNRELARQRGPARPINRESIDEDVLYKSMNSIHWTAEPAEVFVSRETKPEKTHEVE